MSVSMIPTVTQDRPVRLTVTLDAHGQVVVHADGERLLILADDVAMTFADDLTIAAERGRRKGRA